MGGYGFIRCEEFEKKYGHPTASIFLHKEQALKAGCRQRDKVKFEVVWIKGQPQARHVELYDACVGEWPQYTDDRDGTGSAPMLITDVSCAPNKAVEKDN